MEPRISISKDSELFIAICKLGGHVHSFVIIGAVDNKTGQNHILCALGKKALDDDSSSLTFVYNYFINSIGSLLEMEYFPYGNHKHSFTYKAFDFSEEKYKELITYLSHNEYTDKGIELYVRDEKAKPGEGMIPYNLQRLHIPKEQRCRPFGLSFAYINSGNNCRTSAIKIVDTFIQGASTRADVSPGYRDELPFSATTFQGKILERLFILPQPPLASEIPPDNFSMLEKLYKHMETVPKYYLTHQDTVPKFYQLKKLYLALAGKKDLSAWQPELEAWITENQKLIDSHRGYRLFSKTTTRALMDEILANVAKITAAPVAELN